MLNERLGHVLLCAKDRLEDASRWLQNAATGKNANGEATYCILASCTYGNRLTETERDELIQLLTDAIHSCGFRHDTIGEFNDSPMRQHRTVLRVLDTAIASA